ncbi:Galactokinase [Desulfosporosinus sp. I2]|uniref:galactokinase n=1 Tax=Desulfosporosinus sp. I2 TaxID=1617025 RepID=UPI0005EDF2E1|nr:galactokinase [Desulfosporosinus sp. I2]KJR49248.1 Galactokinase [Desulfosporosinus sp. I2]
MPGLDTLRQTFAKVFGYGDSGEELRFFFAPGRVNLIGEHTDFTGGYVLPLALTYGTWAVVHPRRDRTFRLASTSFAGKVEIDADKVVYRQADGWANYPKGVFREFNRFKVRLSGYDILYDGNIPKAAGLSSSASIEMVTATALNQVESLDYSLIELTKLAQRAENQFVGVNCGIMDQFASGMGQAGNAVLLKCDTMEYRYVPLSLGDYQLIITNSNKQRSLTESNYNLRRRECEEGVNIVRNQLAGFVNLGNVSLAQWQVAKKYVTVPEVKKRLDHVIHENERTLASTLALEAGNIQDFGQYMIESHESLRDLFEVTGPELDALFEEARRVEGCLGTRMTGAGFGGCTVSLVHTEAVSDFKAQVTRGYKGKTGLNPTFYHCNSGDGARELKGR